MRRGSVKPEYPSHNPGSTKALRQHRKCSGTKKTDGSSYQGTCFREKKQDVFLILEGEMKQGVFFLLEGLNKGTPDSIPKFPGLHVRVGRGGVKPFRGYSVVCSTA